MKTKLLFSILWIVFAVVNVNAEMASQKLIEADNLYKSGKFPEAISVYQEIINNGYSSHELFYNLGNAYFKIEKIPDAILYYEKARKLSPNDEDINFNLKIANLKIVDKINSVPKIFFMEWYESLHGMFSSETWSYIIIFFSWLAFIFLSGYYLIWSINLRKLSFFGAVIAFVITLACIVFSLEQSSIELSRTEAIIFTPSVYIKNSPDKGGTDLFILHEGTKVKILDEVSGWMKIRIADGNVGWLPGKTIERI